jgi:hypothetical protein
MTTKPTLVFTILKIVAWIIFVGLCIEAGGLIVNFIFSIVKPGVVKNLYQKLDLSDLYTRSSAAFFQAYSFILSIAVLKAILFNTVILLVSKMDLANPFSSLVSRQISRIGYYTLSVGILGYLAKEWTRNLAHRGYATEDLYPFWGDSQAFILMAAVVYIIATIFKKGLALQAENDLTV